MNDLPTPRRHDGLKRVGSNAPGAPSGSPAPSFFAA